MTTRAYDTFTGVAGTGLSSLTHTGPAPFFNQFVFCNPVNVGVTYSLVVATGDAGACISPPPVAAQGWSGLLLLNPPNAADAFHYIEGVITQTSAGDAYLPFDIFSNYLNENNCVYQAGRIGSNVLVEVVSGAGNVRASVSTVGAFSVGDRLKMRLQTNGDTVAINVAKKSGGTNYNASWTASGTRGNKNTSGFCPSLHTGSTGTPNSIAEVISLWGITSGDEVPTLGGPKHHGTPFYFPAVR